MSKTKQQFMMPNPFPGPLRLRELTTLEEVESYGPTTKILLSKGSPWWGRASDCLVFGLPETLEAKPAEGEVPLCLGMLPCDPLGCSLQLADLGGFLDMAKKSSGNGHYGKHGMRAIMACYHGNIQQMHGMPSTISESTSDKDPAVWEEVTRLIEAHDHAKTTVHGRVLAGESLANIWEGMGRSNWSRCTEDDSYFHNDYVKFLEDCAKEFAEKLGAIV